MKNSAFAVSNSQVDQKKVSASVTRAAWLWPTASAVVGIAILAASSLEASAELVAEPTPTAADYAGTLTTDLSGEGRGQVASSDLMTPQVQQPGATGIQEGSRSQDRQAMRSAIESGERMQATVRSPETSETVMLSQSELLRNKRTRLEIQNEDMLQRRLEEIRLRDEQRRMDQLLAKEGYVKQGQAADTLDVGLSSPIPAAPAVQAPAPVVLQEQVVSPSLQAAPVAPAVPSVGFVPGPAVLATPSLMSSSSTLPSEEPSARVSLIPRFGVSNFQDQVATEVNSRFAAGLGIGLDVTDNLAFEIGYTYSEFGVGGWSTNPYVSQLQVYTNTAQPIAVKQNVVDAGLKLYALGTSSRLRPYLFAGAAYTKSFVNYDQQIVQYLSQQGLSGIARDLESSAFLGAVGVGMDIKLSSSIFVGLSGRYYSVLNSNVNSSSLGLGSGLSYPGYGYGGYYYNPAAAAYLDYDKQVLGGGFARSDFYTIAGSIGFSF